MERWGSCRPDPARSDSTLLSVVRTADVLSYMARSPLRLVGVTDIAAAVGTSKVVVFRILTSLLERGYVGLTVRLAATTSGSKSCS
jgi:hypothetical protein